MPPQRVRDAENRAERNSSNGPLRVQSKDVFHLSILQRVGMRQLPGICWYPVECTVFSVKQGGTADYVDSSLTASLFSSMNLSGIFLFPKIHFGGVTCFILILR